jgi:hypothetical protein
MTMTMTTNMNGNAKRLLILLACAGLPLACSGGGAVNIGNTESLGGKLSDYAASWDGYAEAFTFMPSGSDRVRLTIDAGGQGTLRVGDGPLLPPPTDPTVGYPPSAGPSDPGAAEFDSILREGFPYPIYGAQVQTQRIQLGVNLTDLFAAWCAIETPIAWQPAPNFDPDAGFPDAGFPDAGFPDDASYANYQASPLPSSSDGGVSPDVYGCLPNWQAVLGNPGCFLVDPDGRFDAVDCGKLDICRDSDICTCTATTCAITPVPAGTPVSQYPVELDAALDSGASTLVGTLVVEGVRVTVHLQRQ